MGLFSEIAELEGSKVVERTVDVDKEGLGLEGMNDTEEPVEPAPTPAPEFDMKSFSSLLGEEYNDIDSVKTYLKKGKEYDALLSEKQTYESKIAELQGVADKINPLSLFASEDEYVRQQFLLKNKDMDVELLSKVSNLTPSKIDKLSPFEALKLQMLVDNPTIEGGEAGVVELLEDKYGILEDYDSLDRVTKNKLALEAKTAKASLKNLYNGIDVPKKVDIGAERESLKTSWERPLKDIVDGIEKLSIAEGVDFVVTPEMKSGLFEEALSSIVNNLTKPSVDVASELAGKLREKILLKNLDTVIKNIKTQAMEEAKAHYKQEVHNTRPLNNDGRPNNGKLRSFDDAI